MPPPDSYQPYPPPAYGQPQPGPYPAQYPGQYPGQYPPQYPYPYYAPPPQKPDGSRIIAIIVAVVVIVVVMTVVIAGVLVVYMQTLPMSGGDVETTMGLRVESSGGGYWLVTVTAGSKAVSSVRLQVINPSTGQSTVSKMMSNLATTYNDPDAVYNDNNGNSRLDAGDSIQLKSSGGHIAAGYKVQLLVGDSIIGMIKELPA
jgi:hypothetical protein